MIGMRSIEFIGKGVLNKGRVTTTTTSKFFLRSSSSYISSWSSPSPSPWTTRNTKPTPTHINNIRYQSSNSAGSDTTASVQLPKQELMLAFTCNKCSTRSSHTISKQAYTAGTVLVQCPGCKNRHLIADHLKIFKDNRFTIEELMDVSKSTDDLIFDEIPTKLKKTLGYYAKDAPKEYLQDEDDNEIKKLK